MTPPKPAGPIGLRRQRGVGALAVTALLLLAASIVLLYLNRNVIFEQRTSASQMRAASAHELAEAGLEWAIGMLNRTHPINTACADDATGSASFRSRYLAFPTGGAPDHLPVTAASAPSYPAAQPGCSVDPERGALSCQCPDSGAATLDLGGGRPHFTVRFEPEQDNPDRSDPSRFHWEAVRITAIGCAATSSPCTPPGPGAEAVIGGADAAAIASMAVKLRPALIGGIFAALSCGGACDLGDSHRIINTSVAANGVLVRAGGDIVGAGASHQTIPGMPIASALIGHEPILSALSAQDPGCTRSTMFQTFFGASIEQYRDAPTTRVIECSSPTDCGTRTQQAYAEGARAFHFPTGVEFSDDSGFPAGALGSSAEPVLLVTPGEFNIGGSITIHGVLFSNRARVNASSAGSANIHGAVITCTDYQNHGDGTLSYSELVLARLRRSASHMVKVPGSWRDWRQP